MRTTNYSKFCLATILGAASGLLWHVQLPCYAKAQSGYELSIESTMWGAETILVSKEGIKFTISRHNFSGFAVPPDWKIFYYSNNRKQFCQMHGRRLVQPIKHNCRPITLRGLPLVLYSARVDRPYYGNIYDNYMPQLSDLNRAEKKYQASMLVVKEEAYCMPFKNLPREAVSSLREYYGLEGIPLQYILTLSDGQKISKIKFKGWKKLEIPSSTFVPPKNYTRVASVDALVNSGLSSKVRDFSEAWGAGPEDYHKHK